MIMENNISTYQKYNCVNKGSKIKILLINRKKASLRGGTDTPKWKQIYQFKKKLFIYF